MVERECKGWRRKRRRGGGMERVRSNGECVEGIS